MMTCILDGQNQTKGTCGLSKKKQVIFRTRKSLVPQKILKEAAHHAVMRGSNSVFLFQI
ncbi:hypothetical protein BCR42DRAFT_423912 [Absidia repens]|uniref:Uncharacterized protein n=1 Tax=Absidia repens TaxID=90262 RepID=A0A1X2I4F2_9FUNG|nr:hypothetical protein BCR42DRAFT_423912 [Absidia repens]